MVEGLSSYPPGHPTYSGVDPYDGDEEHLECYKCFEFDPKKAPKTLVGTDRQEVHSDDEFVCMEIEKGEVCGGDVGPARCECGAVATYWYTEVVVNYGQVVCSRWPNCKGGS